MASSAAVIRHGACFSLISSSTVFASAPYILPRNTWNCRTTIKTYTSQSPNFQFPRRLIISKAGSAKECKSRADGESNSSTEGNEEKLKNSKVSLDRNYAFGKAALVIGGLLPPEGFVVFSACVVGLLTGIAVVLFNLAVDEIRDVFWDGIPFPAASWLRQQSLEQKWERVVLIPACGGVVVGIFNTIRSRLQSSSEGTYFSDLRESFRSFLNTVAATVTLGTGNSLGPEGPSVEIGASLADGVGKVFQTSKGARLSLVAAGCAAGISSGFNAPVAGCFFAVESVLWPSSGDLSSSITNTTSMVILSAVIASVISQAGLGSDPAFKVPVFDFRSPAELPLYLPLGILCGFISVTLSKTTSYISAATDAIKEKLGIPVFLLPALGGTLAGVIALAYPEVLYRGFENVDILLESQPVTNGLPPDLLLQLVAAKIVATSLSRASQLAGGYYAPSLFIGAALGSAYGKVAGHIVTISVPVFHYMFEVAPPEAYALKIRRELPCLDVIKRRLGAVIFFIFEVGMAATLAGVCEVPLTSVLLLFELTQDYRIIIPLMGAVGFSSWISSTFLRSEKANSSKRRGNDFDQKQELTSKEASYSQPSGYTQSPLCSSQSNTTSTDIETAKREIYDTENSVCLIKSTFEEESLEEVIAVGSALRTDYVSVFQNTSMQEAITQILAKHAWCALVTDNNKNLKGILTLGDIQQYCQMAKENGKSVQISRVPVSEVCTSSNGGSELLTVGPHTSVKRAKQIMVTHGLRQLPVVAEPITKMDHLGPILGLLDRDCIQLACRIEATKRITGLSSSP